MFEFTKEEFEQIVDKAMLNEELTKIFEMKIKDYSITKMAMELNLSESTINRRIKELKRKIMKVLWHFKGRKMRDYLLFLLLKLNYKGGNIDEKITRRQWANC